jgi:hypothetical protein
MHALDAKRLREDLAEDDDARGGHDQRERPAAGEVVEEDRDRRVHAHVPDQQRAEEEIAGTTHWEDRLRVEAFLFRAWEDDFGRRERSPDFSISINSCGVKAIRPRFSPEKSPDNTRKNAMLEI